MILQLTESEENDWASVSWWKGLMINAMCHHMGVSINGLPQNGWFIMDNQSY